MENVTVTPEEFTAVLAEFVKFGIDENKQAVHDGIKKISREAKKEVESKSQVSDKEYSGNIDDYKGSKRFADDNSKHYKDSWTTTTTEENGVLTVTVHNKKFQLVHLLENGHLTRKGTGRTAGTGKEKTRAFKHVEPVQQHAEEKVDALLEGIAK